jgi:hypothetical protein
MSCHRQRRGEDRKVIEEFLRIASATRAPKEVEAHRAYVPNQSDDAILAKLTKGLLTIFESVPGACFMMNALLASGIRKHTGLPVAVVVGDFFVGPHQVFATQPNQDWTEIGRASGTVDGHAWVQIGARMIEASVLRTIRLGGVSSQVVEIAHRELGENRGAVFGTFPVIQPFFYRPRYVMTPDQEEILAASAYRQFVEPTDERGGSDSDEAPANHKGETMT